MLNIRTNPLLKALIDFFQKVVQEEDAKSSSPSADGDQRPTRWIRAAFWEKETCKHVGETFH